MEEGKYSSAAGQAKEYQDQQSRQYTNTEPDHQYRLFCLRPRLPTSSYFFG
jgi:hypothetical protein